ncbi:MAG TPA: YceI family protein [Puia sp.]|nr:YceI family protein [Puia sp.]
MKNSLLLLVVIVTTSIVPPIPLWAQYKPVDAGSAITFTVNNFGFSVDGSFKGIQGTIGFDPQNTTAGHFDVSIDAASVNTDNSLRDSHLRDDGYFDVTNYPRIRLVSTQVTPGKPGQPGQPGQPGSYLFTGELTIKDKTKPVSFPFTATPANGGMAFKGTFSINRKDFGVGGTSTISNAVTISLDIMTTK